MAENRTFVCDLDGVLLNTGRVFCQRWSEILGVEVSESDLTSWRMVWALGVDPDLNKQFWTEVWDIPLQPYPGAGVFVNRVKYLGYKFVVLTSRMSSEKAISSMFRDIKKIQCDGQYEIDEIVICNRKVGELKSHYINKQIPGTAYFLDDHIDNAVDVQIHSKHLERVMLFDRPWNKSRDLAGYKRIYCYGDVLTTLSNKQP